VLPDDEIDALVAALREPSLEEPLRELRRQRLRKAARSAPDGGAFYTPLPGGDPMGTEGGGGGSGGGEGDDGGGVGGAAAGSEDDEREAPGSWSAERGAPSGEGELGTR
jgi:hypothetical protein